MTAVLSATDPLRRDRHTSLDDNQIKWVAEMLAETRAELDDFHHASKELEAELENELQRTEKAQQDLKVKVIRAESERDEWKSKFMSLQTNHTTTTASLQRELDKLRQEYQQTKLQLRDLEMGNDDLERNERAVSSSLADMEAKYSRALEEKILLEHEILEKASLEEESQRLRDELRDANVEISILKDQIANLTVPPSSSSSTSDLCASQLPPTEFPLLTTSSADDLLNTPAPPDLQLDELSSGSESLSIAQSTPQTTPKANTYHTSAGQSGLLQRAGFHPNRATPPSGSSRVNRSTTLPLHMSSPRTPTTRPPIKSNNTSTSTTSTTGTASKSKGVQMVSEMRARVRNLEQKIHTRVPRLRMGSITGRPNSNPFTLSSLTSNATSSSSSSSSRASTAKTSWESLAQRRSGDSRRSNDSGSDKKQKEGGGDSGWVLIMEDSPPHRGMSNPSGGGAPTSFRLATSTANHSPTFGSHKTNTFAQSTMSSGTGIRRPQSRLSATSLSTTTTSSIPTPTSRPSTPTFLPIPSGGLYASTNGFGLKRSTGPGGANPYSAQPKRASLGSNTSPNQTSEGRERPNTIPSLPRPASGTPSSGTSRYNDPGRSLPQLPALLNANITVRGPSKAPSSGKGASALMQSRIGRPSSIGISGRRSTEGTSSMPKPG
ncbi:hypothetical protein H0H81_003802 [Sphagnurus paluster]|uniref:NUDE domain-containing protein n=1 Tax=Sphagnurus paluster TaxID=117069 RepID=A0A9P7KM35_9AGAR|nr:hypothetical protein H0H81_003802 [Sphagnurus paluster]